MSIKIDHLKFENGVQYGEDQNKIIYQKEINDMAWTEAYDGNLKPEIKRSRTNQIIVIEENNDFKWGVHKKKIKLIGRNTKAIPGRRWNLRTNQKFMSIITLWHSTIKITGQWKKMVPL